MALATGACSDNAFIPVEDEEPVSISNAQSIQRIEDEAMAYAAQFLNIFPHKESRSLPDIKIHALTNKSSRSSAPADTLLYVAQYGENQGYAIIPGSRELSLYSHTLKKGISSTSKMLTTVVFRCTFRPLPTMLRVPCDGRL